VFFVYATREETAAARSSTPPCPACAASAPPVHGTVLTGFDLFLGPRVLKSKVRQMAFVNSEVHVADLSLVGKQAMCPGLIHEIALGQTAHSFCWTGAR